MATGTDITSPSNRDCDAMTPYSSCYSVHMIIPHHAAMTMTVIDSRFCARLDHAIMMIYYPTHMYAECASNNA